MERKKVSIIKKPSGTKVFIGDVDITDSVFDVQVLITPNADKARLTMLIEKVEIDSLD